MGIPHVPIVTQATAAKLQVKAAPGILIRADGSVFSAGAGWLIAYDTANYAADSASVGYAPIAVAPLVQVTNAVGTIAAGTLDFKETPLQFKNGLCIVLSSGANPYSANTSGGTGYIMTQYE